MTFPFWCCGDWCNPITCPDWVECLPEGLTLNLTITRTQKTIDDNSRVVFEFTQTLTFTNVKMIIDPINLNRMIPLGGVGNGTWNYHFETTSKNYAIASNYAPNLTPPFDVCPDCKEEMLCETTVRNGSDIFNGFEFYIDCHDPCNEFESPIHWINSRSRLVIDWFFHHDENQTNYNECEYFYGPGNGYVPDNTGLYTPIYFRVWGTNGCLNQKSFSCKSFFTPFTDNLMPLFSEASICTGEYCTPYDCDLSSEFPPYPATFHCCGDWYVESCNVETCIDTHSCWDNYFAGSIIKECNCYAPNFFGIGQRKSSDEGSVTITISIP